VKRIITDSCCDLTPELKDEMGVVSVPLTMMLGNKEFRDDENLDRVLYMEEMKNFRGKTSSSAPPYFLFQEAIESLKDSFVLTLSSKLSASFDNAILGNQKAAANGKGALCVLDSKTASAGQTLIVVKLHELIKSGLAKEHIINSINYFIDNMKTFIVLENYDNLKNNGRLGKVTGTLISKLNIKLVMGADGNGEIALFNRCRGIKKTLHQLVAHIEKSGKDLQTENLVISHCNNLAVVTQLTTLIKERFNFKRVIVVPTGGVSSLYADDKGIVVAF